MSLETVLRNLSKQIESSPAYIGLEIYNETKESFEKFLKAHCHIADNPDIEVINPKLLINLAQKETDPQKITSYIDRAEKAGYQDFYTFGTLMDKIGDKSRAEQYYLKGSDIFCGKCKYELALIYKDNDKEKYGKYLEEAANLHIPDAITEYAIFLEGKPGTSIYDLVNYTRMASKSGHLIPLSLHVDTLMKIYIEDPDNEDYTCRSEILKVFDEIITKYDSIQYVYKLSEFLDDYPAGYIGSNFLEEYKYLRNSRQPSARDRIEELKHTTFIKIYLNITKNFTREATRCFVCGDINDAIPANCMEHFVCDNCYLTGHDRCPECNV